MMALASGVSISQEFQAQQRELAATTLALTQTQQQFYAWKLRPSPVPEMESHLHAQTAVLAQLQAKLDASLQATTKAQEQGRARELELQTLIDFLKAEIKAADDHIAELQALAKLRGEIKKAE